MPGKVYRTAIYCRLSREDGDKVESNSIASQRAICEDYIARHDDLEIVCEPFVDDGYSGVSFNRPNFKKLEDAIRKGAIDCIVVKEIKSLPSRLVIRRCSISRPCLSSKRVQRATMFTFTR